MQNASEVMRYELWDKLKVVFEKYAGHDGEIQTSKVEEIVRDVLGETTPQEIDYVIKNMFRLDTDGNGSVDFLEFVNLYLFRVTFCSNDIVDKCRSNPCTEKI
jgi:Ca2+-binding EF-hand superfamily protein